MSLSPATILQAAGLLVAAIGLAAGLREYRKQGRQKRAEVFLQMREKMKTDKRFLDIFIMIEKDDPDLRFDFANKRDLLGFFEEVALMMNSGLIRKRVVHYMFGSYALDVWESDDFWGKPLDRNDPYWSLFRTFAEQMKSTRKTFKGVDSSLLNRLRKIRI